MAGTCNPRYSGGWGGRIAWTQEAEVEVNWDLTSVLQSRRQIETLSQKKCVCVYIYLYIHRHTHTHTHTHTYFPKPIGITRPLVSFALGFSPHIISGNSTAIEFLGSGPCESCLCLNSQKGDECLWKVFNTLSPEMRACLMQESGGSDVRELGLCLYDCDGGNQVVWPPLGNWEHKGSGQWLGRL